MVTKSEISRLSSEGNVESFSSLFFSPFPTVAESIQKELDDYRASEEEVKRLKNVMVGFKVCIFE